MITNTKLEIREEPSIDYLQGEPYRVRVALRNDDGAYYPVFFPIGFEKKSLPELQDLALDVVYSKNYHGRFEEEQFNIIAQKIAKLDSAIERSETQYQKMEQFMKTMSQTMNETIAMVSSGDLNVETTTKSE